MSPLEHDGEVVDAVARGRTNSRVKTNLERENEQLREQLKFQVRCTVVADTSALPRGAFLGDQFTSHGAAEVRTDTTCRLDAQRAIYNDNRDS